ncbi:hypothetical protein C5167_009099 [Papaver somniferum]|uniref:Uncharacterized protein n=1 Tax=Papaver somniferum TaxID=3469 RepID=A0A4Y7JXV4_PAPSO|nr:hypothetical protein C5167_009099 [Papaver somniferum]
MGFTNKMTIYTTKKKSKISYTEPRYRAYCRRKIPLGIQGSNSCKGGSKDSATFSKDEHLIYLQVPSGLS